MLPYIRAAAERSCSRFQAPSRNPRSPTRAVLVLLGLTTWLGCDGVVEPVPGPAVEVQVTPAGMSISGVGATATFSVEALNANADTITSPAISWSSLNPHVAPRSSSGETGGAGKSSAALVSPSITRPASVAMSDSVLGIALPY